MASSLTPEQIARIEHNRKIALEKRAARLAQLPGALSQTPITTNTSSTVQFSSVKRVAPNSLNVFTKTTNENVSRTNFPPSNKHPATCTSKLTTPTLNQHSLSSFHHNTPSPQKTNSTYPPLSLNIMRREDSSKFPGSNNQNNKIKNEPITGACRLISDKRFTVEIPFQQQVFDIFRSINGKEYDSRMRLWTFPLTEYFNLRKALEVLRPHVVIGALPRCVIETFITKSKLYQPDSSKVDLSRIDEKLRQIIYPFQEEGIQFGVSRNGRCLIADEMGLGKSIQALGVADYFRSDWPLLIVCPSSMRFQWEEEIRVNLPNSVHTHQVFVMTSTKDDVQGALVLIISYDLLSKNKDMIKEMNFGVMILDESHSIKSHSTQRGKAALETAQFCRRVILLSGTPVLSRPAELFTQIQALDPKAFPYFKEYGIRYCNGQQTRFGWDFTGSSNGEELKILLEARFMIRRLKTEVLTQLPNKIRQVIVLRKQSLKKSNEIMDEFAQRLQSSSLKGSERHSCLLSYFAETAKIKAAAVCEFITDLLQETRKFLCFAHHADMMEAICSTLEKNKTYYIKIDGSVSAEDRKSLCDQFQYEDKWRVAVLSLKAANTGITLTAAQVVVFAELFWNPGDLAQAEDRAHRIGQEDCVVVKYLLAKGTADDYLWPLIQNKLEVLNQVGLSKESHMNADTKFLKETQDAVKKEAQTKISDFFENPFNEDENVELMNLMDEFEGVKEKKIKLDI